MKTFQPMQMDISQKLRWKRKPQLANKNVNQWMVKRPPMAKAKKEGKEGKEGKERAFWGF